MKLRYVAAYLTHILLKIALELAGKQFRLHVHLKESIFLYGSMVLSVDVKKWRVCVVERFHASICDWVRQEGQRSAR